MSSYGCVFLGKVSAFPQRLVVIICNQALNSRNSCRIGEKELENEGNCNTDKVKLARLKRQVRSVFFLNFNAHLGIYLKSC